MAMPKPDTAVTNYKLCNYRTIALVIGLALLPAAGNAKTTFTTIQVPDARNTYATAISKGVVGGNYDDHSKVMHGFIRTVDGEIVSFDPDGSMGTFTTGIDEAGNITGYFQTSDGLTHGFLRASDGEISSFDVTDANETYPLGISEGAVAGYSVGPGDSTHGFVRAVDGTISAFNINGNSTEATAISSGVSVGDDSYYESSDGFVRRKNGQVTLLDAPYSSATIPESINATGEIAGYCIQPARGHFAFRKNADGTFDVLDNPDLPYDFRVDGTFTINKAGTVTGSYLYKKKGDRGFAWQKGGKITTFAYPHAARTIPTGIDDSNAIIGYYSTDGHGSYRGFLRID